MNRFCVHMYDVGFVMQFPVIDDNGPRDISGATALYINFQKPDNTVLSRTATTYSGDNTIMQYVTGSGDLDQSGIWKVQGIIDFNAEEIKHSDVIKMEVLSNIIN